MIWVKFLNIKSWETQANSRDLNRLSFLSQHDKECDHTYTFTIIKNSETYSGPDTGVRAYGK